MTKIKFKDSVWFVLWESLKIYFSHIGQFTKYMLFPVFGQLFGLILIFSLMWWFTISLPSLLVKFSIFNNLWVISFIIVLIVVPGLAIFLKALWDYLVAYGALNSMANAVLTSGKLYDLDAHTKVITQHYWKFIGLLTIISLMFLVGINPLFWVIGLIAFVYFILVFQVFTLEEDLSIFDCFRRSFNLIKGNFVRTVLLAVLISFISQGIINWVANVLCDLMNLSEILKGILETWASGLPLNNVNDTLTDFKLPEITELEVAKGMLSTTILSVVTGLTLPVRSVCWTLWYKNLAGKKEESKKDK